MSQMNNFLTKRSNPKLIFGFFALFFLSTLSYAQVVGTGPGGIEKTDGTSNLRLWLKGEGIGGANNGDSPHPWADASGYGRNFENPNPTGGSSPVRSNSVLGGFPVVRFIGTGGDFMSNANLGTDLNTTEWTIYVIVRGALGFVANDHVEAPILSWGNFMTADAQERTLAFMSTTNIGNFYTRSQAEDAFNPILSINSGAALIVGTGVNTPIVGVYRNNTSSLTSMRVNGALVGSGNLLHTPYTDGTVVLGAKLDFSSASMSGQDIAEVVAFNKDLPEVQKIILDNYFSAKYGLNLPTHKYSNGNASYRHNLIGIGAFDGVKHSASTFTTSQAMGGGGVIILEEDKGSLADGEFVMASHILGSGKTNIDVPAFVGVDRWTKIFYIEKTGSVDVKLTFDISSETTLQGQSYILLHRAGTAGAFSKVAVGTPCVVGGKVTFIVPDVQLQNGYYTLGNAAATAQPITLYSVKSGLWTDHTTWTLEADGVTPNNPCELTPSLAGNFAAFITSAHTVTVNTNTSTAKGLTIHGTLDLIATSGHDYESITGNGKIRLASGNFPAAGLGMNGFTTANTGGTVEYYGSAPYTVGSLATYNNLIFSGGNAKTLPNAITVNGNLTINPDPITLAATTLAAGTNNITLRGNWINNGSLYTSGANTVSFTNTDLKQTISGSNTFHNVTINKAVAKNVEFLANQRFNGTLTLTSGNILLGTNNLTLANANIAGTFSVNSMIEMNGLGVPDESAVFVTVPAPASLVTTFPIGTPNNYTPMQILAFAGGTAHSFALEVEPYNSASSNYLKRKWLIRNYSGGFTNGQFGFTYPNAEVVGALATLAILNVNGGAAVATSTVGSPTATQATTNAATAVFQGEWTLGTAPVTLFTRVPSADWGNSTHWSTACGGASAGTSPAILGASAYVVVCAGHTAMITANFQTVSQVTIQATATLDLGTTEGHSFGVLAGDGTLRLASGKFPAFSDNSGFYNSTTAKVIYEGASYTLENFSIFPNIYPNVEFTGTGTKTLPNDNIYVNKNLTINNVSLADNDKSIIIKGDWITDGAGGAYTPVGTNGKVIFNNFTTAQDIGGTSPKTVFNRLEVAKASGVNVVLKHPVELLGIITLSDGNLVLSNSTGIDLTLKNNARFAHAFNGKFTATGMVEMNGDNTGGKLIVERTNSTGFDNTIYPVGSKDWTGVLRFTPFDLVSMQGTMGPGAVSVDTYESPLGANAVQRYWKVETAGFGVITNAKVRFEFNPAEIVGVPLYTFVDPITTANIRPNSSYYDNGNKSFGVSLNGNNYLEGLWSLASNSIAPSTYYTKETGNFGNWEMWTSNANGIPNGSPGAITDADRPPLGYPQATDNIVLLPGANISLLEIDGVTPMNGLQVAQTQLSEGAVLDLKTATGVKLGAIKLDNAGKTGIVKTANQLPFQTALGGTDWTAFVSANTGGTFEFNNTANFELPNIFISGLNQSVYNNLIINLGGVGCTNIATLKRNQLLNGFLSVSNGTFRINDNVNVAPYSLDIMGDWVVGATGCVRVGTGNTHAFGLLGVACSEAPFPHGEYWNMYHKVNLWGNLTNKGSIRLTNQVAPVYRENTTNGAASLLIRGSASAPNVVIDLQGQTDLQQLAIDKGINKNIEVLLTSNNYQNFRLYGRNNLRPAEYINSLPSGANNLDDVLVRKALWIRNGTLRLQGQIYIPSLTEPAGGNNTGGFAWIATAAEQCGQINPDYLLATNGTLWLDGDFVTVRSAANAQAETNPGNILGVTGRLNAANTFTADASWNITGSTAFSVNGLLRVSKGRFIAGAGAGIVMRAEGGEAALQIEGTGVIQTPLIRSSVTGAGKASYTQTGGTVIVERSPFPGATEYDVYGSFSLSYPSNVFNMSGGEIIISHTHNGSNNHGGGYRRANAFEVQSAPGNWNVTGGTVIFEMNRHTADASNTDRFEIGSTAPLWNFVIRKTNNTNTKAYVRYMPLRVLNELKIESNYGGTFANRAILDANSPNTAFSGVTDTGLGLPTNFDVTVGGDMILQGGQYIAGTNKSTIFDGFSTSTATAGVQTVTNNIVGVHNYTPTFENFVVATSQTGVALAGSSANNFVIAKDLYLNIGTLNDGGKTIETRRHIYNNTTHFGTGKILITGIASDTQHLIGGNGSGIFGNVEMNEPAANMPNRRAKFISDQSINGTLTLTNGIVDIDRYNLRMTTAGTITVATPSNTRMIMTRGFQSDGGLSKEFTTPTNATFTYPIGAWLGSVNTRRYTPYTVSNLTVATSGKITVRPSNTRHPLLTNDGSATYNGLPWYWRLDKTGFTGVIAARHDFSYENTIIPVGNTTQYKPGYIDYAYAAAGLPFWTIENAGNIDTGSNPGTIRFDNSGVGTVAYIDGDYTAGERVTPTEEANDAFKAFATYYSIKNGDWNDPTTWSTDGANKHSGGPAIDFPKVGTVAFISASHTVTGTADITVGAVMVRGTGGILNLGTLTGHNLGVVFGEGALPNGTIRISSGTATAPFPTGDLGYFQSDVGGTVEYYTTGAQDFTLPIPTIETYRNLVLNPAASRIINLPAQNLIVYEDFTAKGGGTSLTNTGALGNLKVERNFSVEAATTFQFQTATNPRNVEVVGNITVANTGIMNVAATGGATQDHKLKMHSGIVNNGTFDLSNGTGAARRRVLAEFVSANQITVSGTGGTTDFDRIIIDKGEIGATISAEDTLYSVEFTATNLSLSGDASVDNTASAILKPLELKRGTLKLNSAGADWNINNDTYNITNCTSPSIIDIAQNLSIPEGSMLWINAGTIRMTANDDGGGVLLNGKLKVSGTGQFISEAFDLSQVTCFGNFIEPKASNSTAIEVHGGLLQLGGQIRRNRLSPAGSLRYKQTSGTVVLGTQRNMLNTRGVLEVLNEGSSFQMSGGDIYIVRTAGGTSIQDLYLEPSFSSVSGGTIHFGNASTPATQTMTLQSTTPLWNVQVNATNSPTARVIARPLVVQNNLTINNAGKFDANNLSISVGGNFTNSTVNGYLNSDSTFFNGFRGDQAIAGVATSFKKAIFTNTYLNGSIQGKVSLTTMPTMTVSEYLWLKGGILSDGGNLIDVKGNAENNSVHESPNAIGRVRFSGAVTQRMYGSGSGVYGNVEIQNANNVTMNANHEIRGNLNLNTGLLDIGDYTLTFSTSGDVTPLAFGATKMIRSNGVGSVVKNFTGGLNNFLVPLGIQAPDRYTPVQIINNNPAMTAGTVSIRAIGTKHPSTTDPTADTELFQYWQLRTTGLTNMLIKLQFKYDDFDVRGDEALYLTGFINTSGGKWVRGAATAGSLDPLSNFMTADGGTVAANGGLTAIHADFTAGYDKELNVVDTFFSTKNGNWEDATVWDRNDIPSGSIVVIQPNHTVTATLSRRRAFSVQIRAGGVLDLKGTQLHTLGKLTGQGILRTEFVLPDQKDTDYTDFVAAGGGTIEYSGNINYPIPGNPTYNNLVFSNTNVNGLTMPNINFKLNGSLTIQANSLFINAFGKNINIAGDWTNNGNFINTERGSVVTFEGTTNQFISGNNSSNFRKLVIDKATGILFIPASAGFTNTPIHEYLGLKQGIFDIAAQKRITITNNTDDQPSDLGNEASFVRGYMCKVGNKNYVFPIGDSYWAKAELTNYQNADANTAFCSEQFALNHNNANPRRALGEHFTPTAFAPSTPTSAMMVYRVKIVSPQEYWDIDRDADAGNNATVKVSFYFENATRSNLNTYNPIIMVHFASAGYAYNDATPLAPTYLPFTTSAKWFEEPGSVFITVGTSYKLTSGNNWVTYSPGTVGSSENQLPVRLLEFSAKLTKEQVQLDWKTIVEENAQYFVVQRSADGFNFSDLEVLKAAGNSNRLQNYQTFDQNPLGGTSYYRLKIVDFDQETNYSRIVAISRQANLQNTLVAFPNPSLSGTELYLKLENFAGQDATLTIADAMGRLITNRILRVPRGNSVVLVEELSQPIPVGIYILKLQTQEGVYTQKVLIGK